MLTMLGFVSGKNSQSGNCLVLFGRVACLCDVRVRLCALSRCRLDFFFSFLERYGKYKSPERYIAENITPKDIILEK